MRVLIGFSTCQHTREAFEVKGHEVFTCDTRACDGPNHIQGDVWEVVQSGWNLAIFHPMCTYLTTSAAWAYGDGPYHQKVSPGTLVGAERREARKRAVDDFKRLMSLPYPKAIENPACSFLNTMFRRYDQVIQPYQFGDDASKSTGIWLDRLPPLKPTKWVEPRVVEKGGRVYNRWANQTDSGQNRLSPSADRWLERSRTYPGIARAMGDQWG